MRNMVSQHTMVHQIMGLCYRTYRFVLSPAARTNVALVETSYTTTRLPSQTIAWSCRMHVTWVRCEAKREGGMGR